MSARTSRDLVIMSSTLRRTLGRARANSKERVNGLAQDIALRLRNIRDLFHSMAGRSFRNMTTSSASQSLPPVKLCDSRKHALECLRLAAECRNLAADFSSPQLKAHFLRMAAEWEERVNEPHTGNPFLH